MDTLFNAAKTSEWWLSVVFVGIVINLFSTLIGTFVQRRYGNLIKKWSERNEKLAQLRAKRIEGLASSDHELYLAFLNLNQTRLDSIFELLLAVVLLGFGVAIKETIPVAYTVALIVAMLSSMLGLLSTIRHCQESLLLLDAKFLNADKKKMKATLSATQ